MRNFIWFALLLGLGFMYLQPGHWAMIGGLIALIVAHEFGHWFVARLLKFDVPIFSIGMGSSPRLRLGKLWGTEYQITPWLIGGYVKIDPSDENFASKAAWKRASVLVAGVVMNVLCTLAIVFSLFAFMGQQYAKYDGVSIRDLSQTVSIARDAGLQAGDEFVSVAGKQVKSPDDLVGAIKPNKGTPVQIVVKRNGAEQTYTVTPNQDGQIGIAIDAKASYAYREMSVGEAAAESAKFTWNSAKQMVSGLAMMVGLADPPPGSPDGATDVRGVLAIVQIGEAAFGAGVYNFLMIVALISMNLAFFNILPIPLLDGGHLLFLGLEKLRGRPLSRETQGLISTVFFILLIGLMFVGLFNDIFRPLQLP